VEKLKALGLESLKLDLDESSSIQQAVTEVLDKSQGRLYALFNNGAYGQPGAVEDLSRETLRAQLETNLLGWHELTRLLLPSMLSQGEGRIINNSSLLGFVAMPFRGAYNCSKYALEGLSDTLRLELHGTGVFVSLIEPGPISSRFRDNGYLKYKANIDSDKSRHLKAYQAMEARLLKEGPAAPFTLPPEAVLKAVIKALESPRPKARYPVTLPSHVLRLLKRLLPDRLLDAVLLRISGGGAR
jgi:NAD(P)-dependent dehydrogenase (short-subunit alcohol dehydrogenase family)